MFQPWLNPTWLKREAHQPSCPWRRSTRRKRRALRGCLLSPAFMPWLYFGAGNLQGRAGWERDVRSLEELHYDDGTVRRHSNSPQHRYLRRQQNHHHSLKDQMGPHSHIRPGASSLCCLVPTRKGKVALAKRPGRVQMAGGCHQPGEPCSSRDYTNQSICETEETGSQAESNPSVDHDTRLVRIHRRLCLRHQGCKRAGRGASCGRLPQSVSPPDWRGQSRCL